MLHDAAELYLESLFALQLQLFLRRDRLGCQKEPHQPSRFVSGVQQNTPQAAPTEAGGGRPEGGMGGILSRSGASHAREQVRVQLPAPMIT